MDNFEDALEVVKGMVAELWLAYDTGMGGRDVSTAKHFKHAPKGVLTAVRDAEKLFKKHGRDVWDEM